MLRFSPFDAPNGSVHPLVPHVAAPPQIRNDVEVSGAMAELDEVAVRMKVPPTLTLAENVALPVASVVTGPAPVSAAVPPASSSRTVLSDSVTSVTTGIGSCVVASMTWTVTGVPVRSA